VWLAGGEMAVHNHGPEEGPGLACNESRLSDGSLRGACLDEKRFCSREGCVASIPDTREGKSQAWREGWYLQKLNGPAWCPIHIPSWVPSEFKRQKVQE
jgi:hypothetical protein